MNCVRKLKHVICYGYAEIICDKTRISSKEFKPSVLMKDSREITDVHVKCVHVGTVAEKTTLHVDWYARENARLRRRLTLPNGRGSVDRREHGSHLLQYQLWVQCL